MAKYASLADGNDESLTLTEGDLQAADEVIDNALRDVSIDLAELRLPQLLLTQAAISYAYWIVSVRSMTGENSPLDKKAQLYQELYRDTMARFSRRALGLTSGAQCGSITVGRG